MWYEINIFCQEYDLEVESLQNHHWMHFLKKNKWFTVIENNDSYL